MVEPYLADPGRLREVLSWIDTSFGPICKFGGGLLRPPEPAWWLFTADLSRAPFGSLFSPQPAGAAGTSIDPDEAIRRALGEAVERYSALHAIDAAEAFPLCPKESEIAGRFPACAPDEPCPPSFRGLPLDTPLLHVMARRLHDDAELPIPAGYAHLRYWPREPEPPVTLPISTGLSFAFERVDAIWSGLCEVAERDAMMLTWWLRQSVSEIVCEPDDVPWSLADRLGRLAKVGLKARFFDITSNFRVPTVFCVLLGQSYPFALVGAACRNEPVEACSKALDECVSVRSLVRSRGRRPLPSETDFSWVHALDDHVFVYAEQRFLQQLGFLLNGRGEKIRFSEFAAYPWWPRPSDEESLREAARKLDGLGLTALWLDVTAPEAASLGHVVKVVVPEMVPLSQDHGARWLATPRLLRAARLRTAAASAFNPYPHPFA